MSINQFKGRYNIIGFVGWFGLMLLIDSIIVLVMT